MVPTIRPSEYTSILAPTRCGVDPVVETIVTSAAGSPRSSASATAAKTSWFTWELYGPLVLVHVAGDHRLGSRNEGLANHLRTVRARELAGVRIDLDVIDALCRVE